MSWHESVYFPYHAANLLVVLLAFSTVQFIKLLTELNHLSCESNVLLDKLPQRALQRLAFELNPFEAVKERGDAILHLLEFILHHHGFKYSREVYTGYHPRRLPSCCPKWNMLLPGGWILEG